MNFGTCLNSRLCKAQSGFDVIRDDLHLDRVDIDELVEPSRSSLPRRILLDARVVADTHDGKYIDDCFSRSSGNFQFVNDFGDGAIFAMPHFRCRRRLRIDVEPCDGCAPKRRVENFAQFTIVRWRCILAVRWPSPRCTRGETRQSQNAISSKRTRPQTPFCRQV